MHDILSKYKDRLINLSSRNRSLVLKKIYKKRSFDLSKLNELYEELNDNIVSFLFNRDKEKLLIIEDPYELKIKQLKELSEKINSEKNEYIKKLKENNDESLEQKVEILGEKLNDRKLNEEEKIEKIFKKMIDLSTSLSYINRETSAQEKETGLYELYIGYPFAEGKFKDNTFVKAPLLLFPIRIEYENNIWYIQNIIDQEVLLNKVFVFGFSKYNETKIKEFETDFSALESFGKEIINGLLNYLTENGVKVQDTGIRKIEKFIDHTNQNIPNYNFGEIVLKNYLVLGQFPISNAIYNDYL